MNASLISVIIPVYNVEQYLEECLRSVCANTYQNLEILLVDDGSCDKSGEICDRFQLTDSRIRTFHKENGGVSAARNFGMSKANGEFMAFVDSDDVVYEDYFEKLYRALIQEDADISNCGQTRSFGSLDKDRESFTLSFKNPGQQERENYYWLLQKYYLFGPCAKLFRTGLIRKYDLRFPEDTSYGEDLIFCMAYLEHCEKYCYTSETAYYYRVNEQSLSHRYRENLFENGLRLNGTIRTFSEKMGLMDGKVLHYWANRVYDDMSNSILQLWDPRCTLNRKQRTARIREILHSKQAAEAIALADTSKYSRIISTLMRMRCSCLLEMYVSFRMGQK